MISLLCNYKRLFINFLIFIYGVVILIAPLHNVEEVL